MAYEIDTELGDIVSYREMVRSSMELMRKRV